MENYTKEMSISYGDAIDMLAGNDELFIHVITEVFYCVDVSNLIGLGYEPSPYIDVEEVVEKLRELADYVEIFIPNNTQEEQT